MARTNWTTPLRRTLLLCATSLCVLSLGCASPKSRAPVEDRGPGSTRAAPVAPAPAPAPVAAEASASSLPGGENAGKSGYYTVKPGDTLIRIALETGQNWRDVARWNNIENANLIEVGQVLRVLPPGPDNTLAAARPVAAPGRVETRPLDAPRAASTPVVVAASGPASAPAAAALPVAAAPAAPAPRGPDEDVNWLWPAAGAVSSGFDESRNKGLAISGKAGDPVLAAADGRVVYAGSGLRGYGNLVIVKHNNTYITAYAHNQTLLVKDDEPVRRGQKIAEMGSSDADQVKLHFEIRRQGKPVDPAKLLPPR
jgi:lipoprotein NlpD